MRRLGVPALEWSTSCLPTHVDRNSTLSDIDTVPVLTVPEVLGRSFREGNGVGGTTFTEEVWAVQEGFLQRRGQARALPNFHISCAWPSGVWGPPAVVTPGCAALKGMNGGAQRLPTPATPYQSVMRCRCVVPQAPVNTFRDTSLLSLESRSQWTT